MQTRVCTRLQFRAPVFETSNCLAPLSESAGNEVIVSVSAERDRGNALTAPVDGQCTEFGALKDTPDTIVVLSNLTTGTWVSVVEKDPASAGSASPS